MIAKSISLSQNKLFDIDSSDSNYTPETPWFSAGVQVGDAGVFTIALSF